MDLLKSNPRLQYLAPDTPTLALGKGKEVEGELQFKHDGRGLFASKTVANLADDLDTRALRRLLDRDAKRYGGYRSSNELRNRYLPQQGVPGEIPEGRAMDQNGDDDGVIDWEGKFQQYGTPIILTPDPNMSPAGPSTIRVIPRSREPSEELLGSGHFDQDSFRLPEQQQQQQQQQQQFHRESQATIRPRQQNNLPPILLFGQDRNQSPTEQQYPIKEESPILLLGPNSAQSYETTSTQPYPSSSPRTHPESPIQLLSQSLEPPTRPSPLSFPTETTQEEYETAEEYSPHNLSSADDNDDDDDDTEEEWHDSPVIPREKQPKVPWLADLPTPRPSSPESDVSHPIDFPDTSDHESDAPIEEGIFPTQHSMWGESPIIGVSLPGVRTDSPIESEGSWLSQRLDIQEAVRKSFGGPGARRATPPIILESSPLPAATATGKAGLKKLDVMDAAAMNARAWASARPDYEGNEDGADEDQELAPPVPGGVERVRQGSMVRKVEVLDSPSVEGVIGRVSIGESPEHELGKENGGILLF